MLPPLARRLAACASAAAATPEARLTLQPGGIAGAVAVTLSRPERKNALGKDLVGTLERLLDDAAALSPADARVLVLHSDVPGVFCAGADLKERRGMRADEVRAAVGRLRALTDAVDRLPMPTIAALDGAALGGGLELALACDVRVAGPGAIAALPEVRLGIVPGAGGTQRLSRAVGYARACELTFTARRVCWREGFKLGLFAAKADGDDGGAFPAFARALDMAREVAQGAPVALRAAKAATRAGALDGLSLPEGLEAEGRAYDRVLHTADRVEALRAFAEKRPPVFTGE